MIRYEEASGKRAYTPDVRQLASAVENERVATLRENYDEHCAKLEAAHEAWLLECEKNPDEAPPFFVMRPESPMPLAAVAPPTRTRVARGFIDVG